MASGSPLEILHDLRASLGHRPGQVPEAVRLNETIAPVAATATPDLIAPLVAQAVQPAVRAVGQTADAVLPAADVAPVVAAVLPAAATAPATAPFTALANAPAVAAPASASVPAPPLAMASPALPASVPPALVESGAALPPPGRGDDSSRDMVQMLRQLLEGQQAGPGGGAAPRGRTPPPPGRVIWSHVWQPPGEGYSGQASPSMDVSNIAGTGGASSRRGMGSYGHPGRYWQPESDQGVPR